MQNIFNTLIGVGLVLLFVGCHQKPEQAIVKANFGSTELEGAKVKLIDMESGIYKTVDSAFIDKQTVQFRMPIETSGIFTLRVKGLGATPILFLEPKAELEVDFKSENSTPEVKIYEGKEAKLYKTYNESIALVYNDSLNNISRDTIMSMQAKNKVSSEVFLEKLDSDFNFIKAHPQSLVSLYVLYEANRMGALKYKYLKKWMEACDEEALQSYPLYEHLQNIRKKQEALRFVGRKAPDFTLKTPRDESFSLSETQGKYVLIDFWASWCAPCRVENKYLKELYNQYEDQPFEIISISMDDKKELWEKAIAKDQLTWINVSDLIGFNDSKIRIDYNVEYMPTTFLLDKNGIVIDQDLDHEELGEILKEIF